MNEDPKIIYKDIGTDNGKDHVVLRGRCSFCGDKVTFRQINYWLPESLGKGRMIGVQCEGDRKSVV